MPRYKVVVYETYTERVTYEVEAKNEQEAVDTYWETDPVYQKSCDSEAEVDSVTLLKEGEEA